MPLDSTEEIQRVKKLCEKIDQALNDLKEEGFAIAEPGKDVEYTIHTTRASRRRGIVQGLILYQHDAKKLRDEGKNFNLNIGRI